MLQTTQPEKRCARPAASRAGEAAPCAPRFSGGFLPLAAHPAAASSTETWGVESFSPGTASYSFRVFSSSFLGTTQSEGERRGPSGDAWSAPATRSAHSRAGLPARRASEGRVRPRPLTERDAQEPRKREAGRDGTFFASPFGCFWETPSPAPKTLPLRCQGPRPRRGAHRCPRAGAVRAETCASGPRHHLWVLRRCPRAGSQSWSSSCWRPRPFGALPASLRPRRQPRPAPTVRASLLQPPHCHPAAFSKASSRH